MIRSIAPVSLVLLLSAFDAQAQTLVASTADMELRRGLAGPHNVGLWLTNRSSQTRECDVGWHDPNDRNLLPKSVRERVAPGQTIRIVTNLIATSGESFRCAQDARERRADELRKQQAEQQRLADRQTELDRQRHEQQKQQDASQQLAAQQQQQRLQLDADAEQQAQMARHREAQAQFARESAQNAELARLAQQQQRAQLEQNKARRLEQQRQQNINMQNFGESIRTAENQRRYSENEQLIAERLAETTPEIRLTPKAQGLVNVASLGAGSIDPNHAGSVLVDAGRGCHLRYNKDTRSRPEMNADEVRWDGPCEQGYANGDGELTWTQAGKKNSARLRMVLGAAIPN